MYLTFLGYAYEGELGHPDLMSWLPGALALDTMLIIQGILGIFAGRLILRRSKAAVITSCSVAGIAIVSIIPGYIFWQGASADTSFFLVVVLAPAIILCAIYSTIGLLAWNYHLGAS